MGYVETILEPGEQVLYRAHLHWIVYSMAITWILIALLCFMYMDPTDPTGALAITFSLFIALLAFLAALIKRYTTEIAVTDQRVISKRGLIKRDTVEINAGKIESVDVRQPVLGRILNYGTVVVRGTGTNLEPLIRVANPLDLRRSVARISQASRTAARGAAGAA
jgi:uncharacterized membrane protein YdbT with pleckstrin-like domain